MEEIWKDIKGYENIYQISNLGNVKALYRNNKNVYSKEHYIKCEWCYNGYGRVTLTKDKKVKRFLVHRLVAMAFIPNPYSKPCVNHIDGNKRNNNVNNLEWCSYRENTIHAIENNLIPHESLVKRGLIGANKRKKEVVMFDKHKNIIGKFESACEIEKRYNIDKSLISNVCLGKQKTSHGYYFKYVNEKIE